MDKGTLAYNGRVLSRLQMYLLITILALSVIPHFWHLTLPVSLFFSAILLIRVIATAYSIEQIPRWLIFSFLLAGLIIVIVQYSGAIGKDFGVSLLVAMLSLKVLEIKIYRDAYVLLFLTGFMLVTQFLYNQEMLLTFYIFSLTFFLLCFLLWLNQTTSKPRFPGYLKLVAKLSVQALPVMLILFVFFPRLSGPLWGFDTESGIASTGISGDITPGSISRLSQSSATAFRVKFDQSSLLPDPRFRYWRGPVMTQTDGISWHAEDDPPAAEIKFKPIGKPVSYQITAEASRQHWLFALDLPAQIPAKTIITADYAVRTEQKINQRSTYALISYPQYIADYSSEEELQAARYLPESITPRMQELVTHFQSNTSSVEDFITAVLGFFNRENFIYTLNPPLMNTNPADEFLFEHRKGFCEHYATSFVLLMRLAGIPARVVAGYQGGEWNPAGEHLIIRQSDAHAWTEVWLENKGWTRVDPTAAVAPERIERSIDPQAVSEGAPVVFKIRSDGMLGNVFRQAAWFADSLDLNWHRWIVGFSKQRQQYFLSSAGLDFLKNYKSLGLTAVFLAMLFIVLLTLGLKRKPVIIVEPAKIYWNKFCKKLRTKGVSCLVTDGPETIAKNARQLLPEQASSIQLITDLYISIRYSNKGNAEKLKALRQLVARFR